MGKLVMPAFENYVLREITVRKVDQFIKTLAATKSYSIAKQARTVLSLAFGLAVRYDAIKENPVRDARDCAGHRRRRWPSRWNSGGDPWGRRGLAPRSGLPGPPPDGQLEQLIEVMLGTSARIGEVLAIRKCDVDVTGFLATVRICGTIVSPPGSLPTGSPTPRRRSRPEPCQCPPSPPRSSGNGSSPSRQKIQST